MGVAFLEGEVAGPILFHAVWAAADDPFRRHIETVGSGKPVVFDRGFERMFWKDRHTAEEFEEWRKDFRRDDLHGEGVQVRHYERFALDAKQAVSELVVLGVAHDRVPGED